MAAEWIDCKLADACSSIDYGLTASAVETEVGPRFLRITDIVSGHIDWKTVPHVAADAGTTAKYRLDDGDIVLARTGASTGASSYVKSPPPAVFASYLVRLKAKPVFDSRFLAYYLKSDAFWSFIRGVLGDKSAQPNASASTMTQAPLHAPRNKDEQHAIAHILGTLDDKIELNRRMNETLEGMARALFKSWFVDFDPVRVKAEGRGSCMTDPIADLFPASFDESELGEIPAGWEVGPLGSLFLLDKGLSYKGQYLSDEGVRMVNLGCFVGQGYFAPGSLKGYTGEYQSRHTVRSGDLVLANTDITQKREVIGSPGMVPPIIGEDEMIFTHHVFAARFREGKEQWKLFAFYSLLRNEFRNRATGFATGTTVLALPRDAILEYKVARPPERLLEEFNRVAWTVLERQWQAEAESHSLAAIRDMLLPKLLSGELRVKDAERVIRNKV